jgi:oxygen-independent coproporphyrinogen-3 oxidase
MIKSKNSGIYIHVPFCVKKCFYCDFYSIEDKRYDEYTDILIKEIQASKNKNLSIDSIYFGGGTPSLLDPDKINSILKKIYLEFNVLDDCEISLEVNPGTISKDYFLDLINKGVNRLNIGIQSFNDDNLKLLGRIHNKKTAVKTYENARKAGFKNIGIDFIFALPDQDEKSLLEDIKYALSLNPEHISAYMLTLEKGTKFFNMADKNIIKMLSEDKQADFYKFVNSYLRDNGYLFYEVSNYAKEKKYISRHNYKYWLGNSYLGYGPSAHSFIHPLRWSNPSDFDLWKDAVLNKNKGNIFKEELDKEMDEMEFFFLSFRTAKGLNLSEYRDRFCKDFKVKFNDLIKAFQGDDLIKEEGGYISLSIKGFLIMDYIVSKFCEYA